MRGRLLVLTFAGCFGIYGWAQTSPSPTPPSNPAAEQKAPEPDHSPPAPAVPAVETKESFLEQFANFSAIQNGGPLPGMNVDRYVYRSGKMMRTQGDASVPNYYVTDLETQTSHAIASNGCLLIGAPYTRAFPFFALNPGNTYERIAIGQETVDGHQCHVEDLKIHSPKNPVVLHFRLYEADDLQGFPIKIENRREQAYPWVIHYKDVRLGPQDPSLFIIPQHCQSSLGFKKTGPPSNQAKPKKPPAAKSQ